MQGLGKYEGDWCNVRKNLVFRKGCRSNLLQLLWSFESGDEFHPVLPQHLLPSKNDADNLPYRISTPHSFMRSQGYLVVSWRRLLSSITHSHADDRFFSAYLITMIMFIFKVVIITFHRAFSLRSLRAFLARKSHAAGRAFFVEFHLIIGSPTTEYGWRCDGSHSASARAFAGHYYWVRRRRPMDCVRWVVKLSVSRIIDTLNGFARGRCWWLIDTLMRG